MNPEQSQRLPATGYEPASGVFPLRPEILHLKLLHVAVVRLERVRKHVRPVVAADE